MSGIGTITAEEVFSERVELQPRTSDPSGTEEGEGWIRSDIAPDSNQIATFRVDTGGSTIDVPILQTGTSTDGVVEALRLSVGGTLGYVPAIPESKAAFPALRLQHNGQVYGWHDARGETAFFDVAITATNLPITEGNTLTVDYSVQNTGGSLNDTQDIRLDVGSTERDRDSGVSIASGASATGQLSWGSAVEGSYTASVLSDDEIASTSVSVGSAIPDDVVDTFDYLSDGENLDGRNGWTDSSGHMSGITSFTQAFTFNAVGRAVSSGDPNNFVGKGECFRSLPDGPYGRLKWRQSTDGGSQDGESFISFRQNGNDIVKAEMSDTGGRADGSMFVNDSFIADDGDGNFASDGCTVEFDLTLDYDNNSINGTATETNSNTTLTINEPFVNSASGLDEIYLWNTDDCAIIVDEIEVLGE